MMKRIRRLGAGPNYPHWPRDEFGMTDEEFLLAVLDQAPAGSRIELDQPEPADWVPRPAQFAPFAPFAPFAL